MSRSYVRAAGVAACLVLFGGCYTQLSLTHRAPQLPESTCPDSLLDSCGEQSRTDTVVIRDDRREVCYWTRNWWGEPTLRCYRTYYSDGWVSYYSDPWWYSRYDSYSSYYGYTNCPARYYYDPYTGYCRYYRDYGTYYLPVGSSGSSGSTGGSSSGARPPRRSTDTRVEPAGVSSQPAPLPKEETRRELPAYLPGGSSRASSSVQPPSTQTPAPAVRQGVSGAPPETTRRTPVSRTVETKVAPDETPPPSRSKASAAEQSAPAGSVGQSAPSPAQEAEANKQIQENRKAKKLSGEQ